MIKDSYGNRRFYGVYRGIVVDANDPLNQGRLKLNVPQVLFDQVTNWAWGCVQPGVIIAIPTVGTGVFVTFEGGDPSYPIWMGAFNQTITPTIYGSFVDYRTGTQQSSGVNTAHPIYINTTLGANNTYLAKPNDNTNTKIYVSTSGLYNIQFSAQIYQSTNGTPSINIWLRQNGVDVDQSNGTVDLSSQNHYALPSWNYVQQINAGDYIEFYWTSTSNVTIQSVAAQTGPTVPSTPGFTVTVTQIK